ncbi:hypothetical protein PPL_08046 [Heterostelium album PN500]|uniref:Uncharacterized protein n=1 Tax=Heterostelium pallidum (strain ATCC 26659 / Pp 5 / PN500) TaxID=670386 RepID=D3BHP1_HETP5|nr:hypothetical protein PPL_08046 [Heterostelium album PN500]EFA79218.1 hypothetical protein PPL_08046 [Heterostelium album PN500]|eukprot:XP_020431339.1 hypothetical protein PPL_08046 [Heterostelium album PN500]
MWKRKKDIEGVSNASIVALKSSVLNEERNALSKDESYTERPNKSLKAILHRNSNNNDSGKDNDKDKSTNRGIDERNQKDLDDIKDEQDRLSYENAQRILKEKAKIYEQLVGGKHEKPIDFLNINNEDNSIDFHQKIVDNEKEQELQQEKEKQQHRQQQQYEKLPDDMYHPDIERERMRRLWESQSTDDLEEIDRKEAEAKEKKIASMIKDQEATKLNRTKHQDAKEKEQQQQQSRLKQIELLKKQALLKQKLAASQQKQQQQKDKPL